MRRKSFTGEVWKSEEKKYCIHGWWCDEKMIDYGARDSSHQPCLWRLWKREYNRQASRTSSHQMLPAFMFTCAWRLQDYNCRKRDSQERNSQPTAINPKLGEGKVLRVFSSGRWLRRKDMKSRPIHLPELINGHWMINMNAVKRIGRWSIESVLASSSSWLPLAC